jgi:hypothetical protein
MKCRLSRRESMTYRERSPIKRGGVLIPPKRTATLRVAQLDRRYSLARRQLGAHPTIGNQAIQQGRRSTRWLGAEDVSPCRSSHRQIRGRILLWKLLCRPFESPIYRPPYGFGFGLMGGRLSVRRAITSGVAIPTVSAPSGAVTCAAPPNATARIPPIATRIASPSQYGKRLQRSGM